MKVKNQGPWLDWKMKSDTNFSEFLESANLEPCWVLFTTTGRKMCSRPLATLPQQGKHLRSAWSFLISHDISQPWRSRPNLELKTVVDLTENCGESSGISLASSLNRLWQILGTPCTGPLWMFMEHEVPRSVQPQKSQTTFTIHERIWIDLPLLHYVRLKLRYWLEVSSRIQKLEMHQKIHLGKLEKSSVAATFRQF
jgi:hypothetical protein